MPFENKVKIMRKSRNTTSRKKSKYCFEGNKTECGDWSCFKSNNCHCCYSLYKMPLDELLKQLDQLSYCALWVNISPLFLASVNFQLFNFAPIQPTLITILCLCVKLEIIFLLLKTNCMVLKNSSTRGHLWRV